MRDPAIEAAQRAWDAIDQDATWSPELDPECAELIDAAREALKPIRELHKRVRIHPGRPGREKQLLSLSAALALQHGAADLHHRGMTVAELRALLAQYPDDMDVCVNLDDMLDNAAVDFAISHPGVRAERKYWHWESDDGPAGERVVVIY